MRGSAYIDALGPNLFGDQVSLYSGRVEFVQSDLEIRGNDALPMGVARRLTTGRDMVLAAGMFGDWDLEIPRLHGIFATGVGNAGWAVGDYAPEQHLRCSRYGAPPAGWPMAGGMNYWEPEEYWFGNGLYMPGAGSQPILLRAPANTLQPRDGGSYPLVTKSGWQLGCVPSLANEGSTPNARGEGFVAVAPDGTRWTFNHLVERRTTTLTKRGLASGSGGTPRPQADKPTPQPQATAISRLERAEVWLLPTRAVDRFGNTLTYTYDPVNPWRLLSIQSSDGRSLTFTHDGTSQRIRTVHDGTRTWTYEYAAGGGLQRVIRPDNSAWSFANTYAVKNFGVRYQVNPGCTSPGTVLADPLTLTMTHPSGASGEFTVSSVVHGRSNVPLRCFQNGDTNAATVPLYFGDRSLVSKVLRGPGVATASWSYSYGTAAGSAAPCGASCTPTKQVTVVDPGGTITRSTYGTRYGVDEGRLLREEVRNAADVLVRATEQAYRVAGGGYPDPVGYSAQMLMDNEEATRHKPMELRRITQQGVAFTWQAEDFDVHARATQVLRSSTLGYTRRERTVYFDQPEKWVLGQVESVTDLPGGLVPQAHEYDPATGLRMRSRAFGKVTAEYSYHADGTLKTQSDGHNPPTVLTDYRRGIPQHVQHPDNQVERAEVNNLGLVTSVTNAVQTTTTYGYDVIGRLERITYPREPHGDYHATTFQYQQMTTPVYGLPEGHWRQTETTGNARRVRHFDALWRERLNHTYDATDPAGTGSAVSTRYDIDGRKTYQSYPQRLITSVDAPLPGTTWEHDALGRVVRQSQDSELGVLSTVTDYLGGFRRQVTNPRRFATVYGFQATDTPSEDVITTIQAPEGVNVTIARDGFGKAMSITRSGGPDSATRRYVYDQHQRLCKTIEPETGATIQQYDAAGNVQWRASGQALDNAAACDHDAVPETARIWHEYDARNRLRLTTYGDGSPAVQRSYTPDGLLQQVSSSALTWTYGYNHRRLLTTEQYTWWPGAEPGQGWNFSWGIDSHGNKTWLVDPWGTMQYVPNALGQPTQVSGYATQVKHHPNGAVASYTLDNGVRHSNTQHVRGLPYRWQYDGVVNDEYHYDENGNVKWIGDWQEGLNRQMGYDALDRLTGASGVWGAATFGYDALDNLRSSTVGGRSLVHHIDGRNRLSALTGSQNIGIGYDANGNVTQRGDQFFSFDIGNRLLSAPGKVHLRQYDGHGRRGTSWHTDGSWQLYAYGREGKLLFSYHNARGYTRYVYLGDKLISETTETATTYSLTDVLGSPEAKTSAIGTVLSRTRYEPYGGTAGGTEPLGIGFTGHVNDGETGLVYMQQRYYDPLAGRFLSVDPLTASAKDGEFFGRYHYAYGNPYRFVDPTGTTGCGAFEGLTCHTVTYDESSSHRATRSRAVVNGLKVVVGGLTVALGTKACLTGVGCSIGLPAAIFGVSEMTEGLTYFRNPALEEGFNPIRESLFRPTASALALSEAAGDLAYNVTALVVTVGSVAMPVRSHFWASYGTASPMARTSGFLQGTGRRWDDAFGILPLGANRATMMLGLR